MDIQEAKHKFDVQRGNAKRRGIEWKFTFEQWLEWWGDDIDRRGVGPDDLQMQRYHDKGPYSPENVRKGVPKDNAKTRGSWVAFRNSTERRVQIFRKQMETECIPSKIHTEEYTEDEIELHNMFGRRLSRASFL